jgi:hypothetical protein
VAVITDGRREIPGITVLPSGACAGKRSPGPVSDPPHT